jgi:leucyl-tRNA synthetase
LVRGESAPGPDGDLSAIKQYVKKALQRTERDRQQDDKQKTGVFTGLYATNRLNDEQLPIYVADFVLGSYGTGAVVGVPGHDLRDFQFAKAMKLPVIRVVKDPNGEVGEINSAEAVFEGEGEAINSGFLDGLSTADAQEKVMDHLEKQDWASE